MSNLASVSRLIVGAMHVYLVPDFEVSELLYNRTPQQDAPTALHLLLIPTVCGDFSSLAIRKSILRFDDTRTVYCIITLFSRILYFQC